MGFFEFIFGVIALVAFARTMRLNWRIDRLERELRHEWLRAVSTVDSPPGQNAQPVGGQAPAHAPPAPVLPATTPDQVFASTAGPVSSAPPETPASAHALQTAASHTSVTPRQASAAPDDVTGEDLPPVGRDPKLWRTPQYGPETPQPPSPPRPPTIGLPSVDWEQILGVRAAAIVSAVALGLAGLLFFKYSIENGLIPPWLRVVLGTVVGLASVVGSELALRRSYAGTANALAGGGLVVLYAAFWAAGVRYELIGFVPAFVLMASVTVTGCVLAWRHEAQVTAILALIGGFATPILLSRGSDRPFALFGYLLMLDAGLIVLALKRGWPRLAQFGLLGTLIYQAGWIGMRMGPDRLWLGLAVLGVFAVVFAAASRRATDSRDWRLTQAAAILMPFTFALYFSWDVRFTAQLLPVGLLLMLLSAAAGWLARMQKSYELSLAAAAAGLGVLVFWSIPPQPLVDPAWHLLVVTLGLALLFHAFVEWEPEREGPDGPAPGAIVATIGHGAVVTLAMVRSPFDMIATWVGAWCVLAALLVRHGGLPGRGYLDLAAPLLTACFLVALDASHAGRGGAVSPIVFHALALAAAAAFQGLAIWRKDQSDLPFAEFGAGAIAAIMLAVCSVDPGIAPPAAYFGTTLALGWMMGLVAARTASGAWLLGAVILTAASHASFATIAEGNAGLGLAAGAVGILGFTAWPFVAGGRLRGNRFTWYAAALAGPLWFWPLRIHFLELFGDGAIGVLPVALGAVSMAAAFLARDALREDEQRRTSALAWLAAVALGFVSVAIPLQLEKSWITIGWALEGVAVLELWTRLQHPGLKYFGLALLAAVTARLVLNVEVLTYYPRPEWRIVNWLMYTYLVPAACLLAAASVLQRFELARATAWERATFYTNGIALGAAACGVAAIGVTFVWLNLAIADWFSTGTTLAVSFERMPARDLATSLAWAIYAIVLLGIGMARTITGLRKVSLALLVVTIAKVFLHDLGELRDLYRVASLVGLAISLLGVSLAYQRFVFRGVPDLADEEKS